MQRRQGRAVRGWMAEVTHWQDQLPPPPEACDFGDRYAPRFCMTLAPMVDDDKRKGFGWRTDWLRENAHGALIPSGKGSPGEGAFAGLFYRADWGKPGHQVRVCPFCEAAITPPHPRAKP